MSLVSCHVQKYTQTKDGYTEYFILILYQGREWAIRKRYSDFCKFDEYLRSSGYTINYQLPEKNWWNKFDPTLLTRRLKELQNYLDVLLREEVSAQNSLVREFLEVDENMLEMAKKSSTFKDSPYAERVILLVKRMRVSMIGIPSHRESLGDVVAAAQSGYGGRNQRENSKYYYREDSPGGTPRQQSRDHRGGGSFGTGATGKDRGNSGSFSGGGIGGALGGALRIGIGSFSGGIGHAENAAQALADAARREAFAGQAARLWLLLGKQTEARIKELDSAFSRLPIPWGAEVASPPVVQPAAAAAAAEDEDDMDQIWRVAGGGGAEFLSSSAPTATASNTPAAASSAAWVLETMQAPSPANTADLLALHTMESDTLAEDLPKNNLQLLGDPRQCVFLIQEPAVPASPLLPPMSPLKPGPHHQQPPDSPASAKKIAIPGASPKVGGAATGAVGRDQLRRINSDGKKASENSRGGEQLYGQSL